MSTIENNLILDLCREAGDDISDEAATLDAFRGNHHADLITDAAAGQVLALAQLRQDCGLPR